jgi:hypothetical protein
MPNQIRGSGKSVDPFLSPGSAELQLGIFLTIAMFFLYFWNLSLQLFSQAGAWRSQGEDNKKSPAIVRRAWVISNQP